MSGLLITGADLVGGGRGDLYVRDGIFVDSGRGGRRTSSGSTRTG